MKIIMQPIEQKGHLGKVSMQPPHQLKIKDLKWLMKIRSAAEAKHAWPYVSP